jgi:hypothetical protein
MRGQPFLCCFIEYKLVKSLCNLLIIKPLRFVHRTSNIVQFSYRRPYL